MNNSNKSGSMSNTNRSIEKNKLFDFDREVYPIVNVIVTKTL